MFRNKYYVVATKLVCSVKHIQYKFTIIKSRPRDMEVNCVDVMFACAGSSSETGNFGGCVTGTGGL